MTNESEATNSQPAEKRPRQLPRWMTITSLAANAALLIGLLAVGGVTIVTAVSDAREAAEAQTAAEQAESDLRERHRSFFAAARNDCDPVDFDSARVTDGGKLLELDGQRSGYTVKGLAFDEISCILNGIEAPASVASRMGETRALDGTQEAEWDDIAARWTYHPDDGLAVIIEYTS